MFSNQSFVNVYPLNHDLSLVGFVSKPNQSLIRTVADQEPVKNHFDLWFVTVLKVIDYVIQQIGIARSENSVVSSLKGNAKQSILSSHL